MRVLTFTTLYPNCVQASHGIFVEQRLRQLRAHASVESKVVAPVPWFPFRHSAFGQYGEFARVPRTEWRHETDIRHPRYPVIPLVGMTFAPFLLARAAASAIQRIKEEGFDFDLIDAHFFYPDGVAAVMLGRRFDRPVVITARGTDLNLYPKFAFPRRMIRWAAKRAAGLITVCEALREALAELGIDEGRVRTLRNGVDLQLFRPNNREAARRELEFRNRTLLSVGHLIPRKGHDIPIRALPELPDTDLVLIGEGPERGKLERLVESLGVERRVRFLGAMPQEKLREFYGAADALVLASSREGWANVLLESMACGTPVVATNIWGTPEVVATPDAGVLMAEQSPKALVDAIQALFDNYPGRSATRRYAEQYDWSATSEGQMALFRSIVGVEEGTQDRAV